MVAKAGRLTHFDQNGGFYCLCFRAMKHFVWFLSWRIYASTNKKKKLTWLFGIFSGLSVDF